MGFNVSAEEAEQGFQEAEPPYWKCSTGAHKEAKKPHAKIREGFILLTENDTNKYNTYNGHDDHHLEERQNKQSHQKQKMNLRRWNSRLIPPRQ